MALFYRNAKKQVQKQYDDLVGRGFQPTANADGTTYSWIHKDTGEVYKGLDPISGIDAENGPRIRNYRQQRLMSELASSNLVKPGKSSKSSNTSVKTPGDGSDKTSTITREAIPGKANILNSREAGKLLPPSFVHNNDLVKENLTVPDKQVDAEDTEDMTPGVYNKDKKNLDDPFVYTPTQEWQKEHGPLARVFLNKYGTNISEIRAKQNGWGDVSGDLMTSQFPHSKTIDGKGYSLIHNPDWVATPTKPGIATAQWAQAVLSPANVKAISPNLLKSVTKAQAAFDAAKTAKATTTEAAATVGKTAGEATVAEVPSIVPKKVMSNTLIPRPKLPVTKVTMRNTLIPRPKIQVTDPNTLSATNVWNKVTNPAYQFKIPSIINPNMPLGPGFKKGGKLLPKVKMKGRC
jgi:hypothetical protein